MMLETSPVPSHPKGNGAASPAQSKRERRAICPGFPVPQLLCRGCLWKPQLPDTCTVLGHVWHPSLIPPPRLLLAPACRETCVLCVLPTEARSPPRRVLHRKVRGVCCRRFCAALPAALKGYAGNLRSTNSSSSYAVQTCETLEISFKLTRIF